MPRLGPNRGRIFTDKWKKHISRSLKRYFADPIACKKLSDMALLRWKDLAYRAKRQAHRKLRVSSGRYYKVYRPNHPRADVKGYVAEHHLVAETILGRPIRPNEVVHHINGNHYDNRPENLAVLTWSSHSQHHATEQGLGTKQHEHRHGYHNKRSRKLTEDQAKSILKLYRKGVITQAGLGEKFGVSQNAVSSIVTQKRWKHLSQTRY